ncbi:MAG: SixA phosphatase family protein [Planctomycetota bacterium]
MQIYLIRHGIAIDREDPDCPAEPERELTQLGYKRTRRAMKGLRRLGLTPQIILTSPYRRCVQTAELAARCLHLSQSAEAFMVSEDLLPESRPNALLDSLASFEGKNMLIVGHAPHLDMLLAAAVGSRTPAITSLGKAAVACLELGDPPQLPAQLAWLLKPSMLRLLAKL